MAAKSFDFSLTNPPRDRDTRARHAGDTRRVDARGGDRVDAPIEDAEPRAPPRSAPRAADRRRRARLRVLVVRRRGGGPRAARRGRQPQERARVGRAVVGDGAQRAAPHDQRPARAPVARDVPRQAGGGRARRRVPIAGARGQGLGRLQRPDDRVEADDQEAAPGLHVRHRARLLPGGRGVARAMARGVGRRVQRGCADAQLHRGELPGLRRDKRGGVRALKARRGRSHQLQVVHRR